MASFVEALKKKVDDDGGEIALFNKFLEESVAPFFVEQQGQEIAVLLVVDMMAAGCTSPLAFRQLEAGVEGMFVFSKKSHETMIRSTISGFLLDKCQRRLDIDYKKPNSATVNKQANVPMEDWTLERINVIVRGTIKEQVAHLTYTVRGGDTEPILTEDKLKQFVRSGAESLKITAHNQQKDFSLYTNLDDALKVFGEGAGIEVIEDVGVHMLFTAYSLNPSDESRRAEIVEEIQHARKTLKKLKPIAPLATHGLEATERLYIDPVLLASARIVQDVKLYVEKKIAGRRVHGPVDYIFTLRDKIICCVTEAKSQELQEGLAQNVAQMGVIREMMRRGTKKRKIQDISEDEEEAGEHDLHLWRAISSTLSMELRQQGKNGSSRCFPMVFCAFLKQL